VPSPELFSRDDLDEIGDSSFGADDPLAVAAELVAAVRQGRVVDKADTGYALMLAAEITERTGDLDAAHVLAERAVEAYRTHGDPESGYPAAFRAGLLLRLGREEEAMAELAALRPLLVTDPDACWYLSEVLQEGGHAETAERWLSVALETALERRAALEPERLEPRYTQAAAVAFALAQCRHRLRRDLGLPHDANDVLADQVEEAVYSALAAQGGEETAALFWPRAELEQVLLRWPGLAEEYGQTWEEHRTRLERGLLAWAESGVSRLSLLPGSADGLAGYASRGGHDPTDPAVRQGYLEQMEEPAGGNRWPPGRNEPCWCGSGLKYKKCCLPRSRA
jgi:hypothetical protein